MWTTLRWTAPAKPGCSCKDGSWSILSAGAECRGAAGARADTPCSSVEARRRPGARRLAITGVGAPRRSKRQLSISNTQHGSDRSSAPRIRTTFQRREARRGPALRRACEQHDPLPLQARIILGRCDRKRIRSTKREPTVMSGRSRMSSAPALKSKRSKHYVGEEATRVRRQRPDRASHRMIDGVLDSADRVTASGHERVSAVRGPCVSFMYWRRDHRKEAHERMAAGVSAPTQISALDPAYRIEGWPRRPARFYFPSARTPASSVVLLQIHPARATRLQVAIEQGSPGCGTRRLAARFLAPGGDHRGFPFR